MDRCAGNHTIGAVPLLSFHCEAVLQKEPAANCTFSAYSALQNWAYQFVGENPSRKPPLAASRAVRGAFCLLKKGGVGFPAGDGEAQTACLKEKGLKRFQCHRAIQMESSLLACIPMIAYTTWFFKPFHCFFTTKNVCARRLVQQYTLYYKRTRVLPATRDFCVI